MMYKLYSSPPEIDRLHIERRQLYDRFRAEQLAFNEQLRQQSEEERQRRDENRAAREARRKFNKFRYIHL